MSELWSEDFEMMHGAVERSEHNGYSIEVGEALRVFPRNNHD